MADTHRDIDPFMRQIDNSVIKPEFDIQLRMAFDQFSHQRHQVNASERNGRTDSEHAERLFTAPGHARLRRLKLLEDPIDMAIRASPSLVGDNVRVVRLINRCPRGAPVP
ncbi:hypothetical protein QNM99_28890 [Pseudomonas sp. PCH446]